jgi:hypothetical protein
MRARVSPRRRGGIENASVRSGSLSEFRETSGGDGTGSYLEINLLWVEANTVIRFVLDEF